MNQRRRFIVALVFAGILAVAMWFIFHSREPVYQGKKLGVWLRELESAPDIASPAWQESARALRQMGTNALPRLVASLSARDPNWKIEAVDWVRQVFNKDWSGQLVARDRQRSLLALQVLGPLARPAIPEFAAMLTNASPDTADAAFFALSAIGSPETVPPLLLTLTNGAAILRPSAAVSLGGLRRYAGEAVPALAAALASPDANLRNAAARALGLISQGPQEAVTPLIHTLGDTNVQVQRTAAAALAAFGTDAAAALPALRALPLEADDFPRRGLARAIVRVQCEMRDGGIIRGPQNEKRIALVFTGHEYAEGGETIINELERRRGHASFFLTGDFLRNPRFSALLDRMTEAGHYVGPHSDKHLLYCTWEEPRRTLVNEEEFTLDLFTNVSFFPSATSPIGRFSRYFLPPFEHYNRDITDWARKYRWTLINFTPGTRSNADYTGEADTNFVSSQAILDSILKRELEDPNGLNGFILLLHLGSGPGRADKFHSRFGELLDDLNGKGYAFVRVDELLEPKREEFGNEYSPTGRR